jgi:acetoacetyl-CoA synthetase
MAVTEREMKTNSVNGTNGAHKDLTKLWEHPNPEGTPMWDFKRRVNRKYGLRLSSYEEMHAWSTEHIAEFWGEVWQYTGVRASKPYTEVSPSSFGLYIHTTCNGANTDSL